MILVMAACQQPPSPAAKAEPASALVDAIVAPPDAGIRGAFAVTSGQLSCVASHGFTALLSAEKLGYQPCMHIGPIAVGMTRDAVESLLGRPTEILSLPDDAETRLYPLSFKPLSYFAVGYRQGRAFSVQATGGPVTPPLAFAEIRLGAPAQALLDRLGAPQVKLPLPAIAGELWGYSFPTPIAASEFSFELEDGRITSIRVAYPDDQWDKPHPVRFTPAGPDASSAPGLARRALDREAE